MHSIAMPRDPIITRVHFVSRVTQIRLPRPTVVICDRNAPISIRRHFPGAILVSAGERLKSLTSIERLAAAVLVRCRDRDLTLAAVGGGSVGDAVGFLAGILWRGVRLVHVPTTLVAMADSAHGGKTAANLREAKNQLGVFHPASDAWIVTSLLKTLPKDLIDDGLAEIVKAALIGDQALVALYLRRGLRGVPLSKALRSAVAVKQRVCRKDPLETHGYREILNFGHTLGHAIERTAGLPHGRAVAWGLCAGAVLSERFGFRHADRIRELLQPLLIAPDPWPSRAALRRCIGFDKKHRGRKLRSVVLRGVGKPILTTTLAPDDWIDALADARRRFHA